MKLVMQCVKQKTGETILEINTKTTKLLRTSLKSKKTFSRIYNKIWQNVSLSDVLANELSDCASTFQFQWLEHEFSDCPNWVVSVPVRLTQLLSCR